jgi:hypothetical protein
MSDELAIEVIRLRHGLRAMAALPCFEQREAADTTLERFRDISQSLGDPELLFEHARWRVQFEQMGI